MAIRKSMLRALKARGPEPETPAQKAVYFATLLLALLVNAPTCVVFSEIVARSADNTLETWMRTSPSLFLASCGMVFSWSLFFLFAFARASHAMRTANLLLLVPAAVNCFKVQLRGEPLLLTDIGEIGAAIGILPHFQPEFPRFLIAAIALLGVVLPFFYRGCRIRLSGGRRLFASALSLALCCEVSAMTLRTRALTTYHYDRMYSELGFIRALWNTLPRNSLKEPDGYGPQSVLAALSGCEGEALAPDALKPDIFFIMCESMYDLSSLGGLEMTADPLDGLKALQLEYAGAEFLAPKRGGGTFKSEFEVLTGYRTQDTPGTVYYDHSATAEGMATLVTVLREAGYATTAVHPNKGSFYNRAFNYKRLGFERALFSDSGLPEATEEIGGFPTDEWLYDAVLEDYASSDPEKPYFCHVVTFQNHASYATYEYGRRDILVTNREGTERLAAENYANGELSQVEALEGFLGRLSEQERPAVVVCWGDHMPNITAFGLSYETGTSAYKYYSTPVLLWNNYGADLEIAEEFVSSYRLGALVLSALGFRTDPYFNFLAAAQPDLLTALRLIEEGGRFSQDEARYDEMDRELLLLHYDRLIGNGWWEEAKAP